LRLKGSVAIPEEQRDAGRGVESEIRHYRVQVAIFVEIAHGDVVGVVADCKQLRRLGEVAFSISQHHGEEPSGNDQSQVGLAIPVEIADCHGELAGVGIGVQRGLESTVAVAQKHCDIVAVGGHDQVGNAIAIHIPQRDRVGRRAEELPGSD